MRMATVQRFEDLKVWQFAREQAKQIYQFIQRDNFAKDYELKNQVSRSSGSVMDNIAEGFGRGSRAEFILFLGYSLGSNDEVKSQLHRAFDRTHINQQQFDELYAVADRITKMLVSLMNYLKKTSHKGFKYNTSKVEEPYNELLQTGDSGREPQKLQTTNDELQTFNQEDI